ncbi:MAG TPA: transposase, partial [Ktedonobacteraceae bacterium]
HIPETVAFRTKPELGQRMIQRVQAAGLPIGWVVADTVYGHSPDLRAFLENQGLAYALAVPSIEVVCVQTRAGLLLTDVASIAQQALRARDWQRLSQSLGTKGERLFDWARLPVVQAGVADGRHWLVVRRCLDDPTELAYYLVWAPPQTPLSLMVQAIGARWHIEEDLHAGKALGLDQYEVRSYQGWYRHVTLLLLAAAFLVGITVQNHLTAVAQQEPVAYASLIPLTPSEARHLLAHLFWPAPTSAPLICHWSWWRRTHHYWAGYYHRRRRAKTG